MVLVCCARAPWTSEKGVTFVLSIGAVPAGSIPSREEEADGRTAPRRPHTVRQLGVIKYIRDGNDE